MERIEEEPFILLLLPIAKHDPAPSCSSFSRVGGTEKSLEGNSYNEIQQERKMERIHLNHCHHDDDDDSASFTFSSLNVFPCSLFNPLLWFFFCSRQ